MIVSPQVSILVPVYNREEFLEECVVSALSQTVADLEVVITDNASTDGTWGLCGELARRDSRVRIFRNPANLGPVRNWHRAAAAARAPLARLLFSDDRLHPRCIERTAPPLEDPRVGMVTSAAEVSGRIEYSWRDGRTSSLRYLWSMMFNGRLPVSPCAATLRTADLRRNLTDFGSHGIGPDLLLLLRTAGAYPSIVHFSDPLVYFRDHAGSISREREFELAAGYAHARMRFIFSLPVFSRARTTQT